MQKKRLEVRGHAAFAQPGSVGFGLGRTQSEAQGNDDSDEVSLGSKNHAI